MLASVYIETTIPSYLTSWPSENLLRASHQKTTKDWWAKRRGDFSLYISQFVHDEAARGDASAASDRLNALSGIPFLPITEITESLTLALLDELQLPPKAALDAAHISISATNGVDFLLTWNCRHINNAELIPRIEATCRRFDVACPVICTPEELMGI